MSDEHFNVDGTLIEVRASEKSYGTKPNPPPEAGKRRNDKVLSRDSHISTTNPHATMYRKSLKTSWRLSHMAHAVSENLHGLIVATAVSSCSPLGKGAARLNYANAICDATPETMLCAADVAVMVKSAATAGAGTSTEETASGGSKW